MITDVEKVIREYIPQVIHLSLGTSKDNIPWVSELHYAYDENLNLYFKSLPSTRHCKELTENPTVAGNIIRQHNPGEKPRGVYFEGKCEIVKDLSEDNAGFKAFSERFGIDKSTIEEAKDPNAHQMYKISIMKFYVFDTIESKPSQKYELVWQN
ncbi:MAG: pyridoxamine 5'-phosphate oxidase family protein [Candidatus Dojkabacteria bacterium]